jgi:2-polyprenyl-3-methyl-5-hydroxy-6-metoxy-1,4-benzoquinol methylase
MEPQNDQYETLLKEEGKVWGDEALKTAAKIAPDWQEMRRLPHHAVLSVPHIEYILSKIQPGWRVLEIGCASGWLSLEMARRGASVRGIDVASDAIALAQRYAQTVTLPGSVEFSVADVNSMTLETEHFDLIVASGVIHHLAKVDNVLTQCQKALLPNGLLYISDAFDTPKINALINGGLMFLLPTHLTYAEKFRHLLRLRGQALEHVTASIEAKGLSPFEGYGRHQTPIQILREKFNTVRFEEFSAFTGYIIAQLNLPDPVISILGHILYFFDTVLVKMHLLHGLNYIFVGTPRE